MSLVPGARLGPYEVVALLGAGGMGEVYRARDTKLHRDVAIKVLPDLFASDPERLARLTREAQVLAALNHPHIAHIHGLLEESSPSTGPGQTAIRALVMELVEGEDLAQRLTRGPMPLEEALPIARQIVDALEAAHEQGIIHRDLKPANIKVRGDGTVKVLDFGLAKALDPAPSASSPSAVLNAPTITSPAAMTRMGIVLGTAAYMAPEQARGKAVDKRADIWAFGCVLYEMLTARRAFAGEDVADTLAFVLTKDPDWSALPASTPAPIRTLLRRCLEKDHKRRLADIADARLEIDEALAAPIAEASAASTSPYTARWWRVALGMATGIALGLLVARVVLTPRVGQDLPRVRFAIPFERLAEGAFAAVVSPDGHKIAFIGNAAVWVRWLAEAETRKVAGDIAAAQIFWSPDSAWIGIATSSALLKVSLDGGTPVRIADISRLPGPQFSTTSGGAAWLPHDRIIFTTGFSGLLEVSARGGEPAVLTPVSSSTEDFHGAAPLPDGTVLTVIHRGDAVDTFEAVRNGQRRVIYRAEGQVLDPPVYSATGHLLYSRAGANSGIWALPFDAESLTVTGPPFLVMQGDERPSVSGDGRLLVGAPLARMPPTQLLLMVRGGQVETPIGPAKIAPRFLFPALSPDGRRVAIAVPGDGGQNLWLYGISTAEATQVTSGETVMSATWRPDGSQLVVVTGSSWCLSGDCFSIGTKRVDGGEIVPIARGWAGDMSPDGRFLVYAARGKTTEWDLVVRELSTPSEPKPFQGGAGWQYAARFSPDGRYVAYVSNESGRPEVYVARFPSGDRWRVSNGGGHWPRWRGDGARLYFARGSAVIEVPVSTGPSFSLGAPVDVLPAGSLAVTPSVDWPHGFDVSPDGKRFLVSRPTGETAAPVVQVEQNWFARFADRR